jgi:glutamate-ammonia-ligase adenylyltransferase
VPVSREQLESLVRDLPDPEGARLFYERMTAEHVRAARAFERDAGLLSDALALAAWSPLLGTTLAQHPDYLSWLARERALTRVRTTEELGESLARFALTHTQVDAQVMLARFRRRELLRIYLHDIRRDTTLVETTEELSNLADAVLAYALGLAQQELENLYGVPQCEDARGRKTAAGICIVALGKLGSRELNYSSDIDLMFLYSEDGETTGKGERGTITNREFFVKLAAHVAKTVGQQAGEGAAYRVDLRLRPHGRDGALACSLSEALLYYRRKAHAWELQALIRSRAAAGSAQLFARFAEGVTASVYRSTETVARALGHVRLAKQKIDRQHPRESRGFNVKLGQGGIREIEFIAQALQLAYGGRDLWLHAAHTLISLGRLADRGLINERERSELSDAYAFLRTVEHRVQMEHGLQTHLVPDDPARRALLARRMHFAGSQALEDFDRALLQHTSNVSRAYRRVFESADEDASEDVRAEQGASVEASSLPASANVEREPDARDAHGRQAVARDERSREDVARDARAIKEPHADVETASAHAAANVLAAYLARGAKDSGGEQAESAAAVDAERLAPALAEAASRSLNARRALTLLARIAASLDKSGARVELTGEHLRALVGLCGASEFFGEMIASNPALIPSIATAREVVAGREHRALLRAAIDPEKNFGGELSALRRAWAHLLVEIGARDAAGDFTLGESNALQTSLAAASVNAALLVARRELARRYGRLLAGPRLAVLGLGRLASGGTDFGSDLDLVLVYDQTVPSPLAGLTQEEAYARLVELMTTALSSMTRDGYLYRVDLRLRPDGKNGAVATSAHAFESYLSERADVWEWLAHVKLRAVAGDLELGKGVERRARRAVHEAARRAGADVLRTETRRVRERLEHARAPRGAARPTDIKYGPGGMLDVYFAVRYLQLRDGLPDDDSERSTRATLERLRDGGSLGVEDTDALCEGYALLRRLDHQLRLLVGRSTRLPSAPDHPHVRDLSLRLGYSTPAELTAELDARMQAVRAAYDRITKEK